MSFTKIAPATPFVGAPKINLAGVYGASPCKPIILRVPVIGERPVKCSALGLPKGLSLDGQVLSGSIEEQGSYEITIVAENAHGKDEKRVRLEIAPNHLLLTPLLGFTTWNAFGADVSQKDLLDTADRLVELGIAEYGYGYVNTDSGWQGEYGGKHDAIMPNYKFPDMRAMTDAIHAKGLKCGIYSTPMLTAWGCPKEFPSIPGCTVGERDYRFADTNTGIGLIRKERNNVAQWDEWGFDYLKYDWRPTDSVNAELMRVELLKASRDFGFCVTVEAMPQYRDYWSRFCNSYRSNEDSDGTWKRMLEIYETYFGFMPYVNQGHYFDLDMLDIGTCRCDATTVRLSEDEMIFSYSMRAFLNSPIQISSVLDNVTDFEMALYCNEEILAIHQDAACSVAKPILRAEGLDVMEKQLSDGSYAYAFFCIGESACEVKAVLDCACTPRDVWAKCDLTAGDTIGLSMQPHTVRILRSASRIKEVKLA